MFPNKTWGASPPRAEPWVAMPNLGVKNTWETHKVLETGVGNLATASLSGSQNMNGEGKECRHKAEPKGKSIALTLPDSLNFTRWNNWWLYCLQVHKANCYKSNQVHIRKDTEEDEFHADHVNHHIRLTGYYQYKIVHGNINRTPYIINPDIQTSKQPSKLVIKHHK